MPAEKTEAIFRAVVLLFVVPRTAVFLGCLGCLGSYTYVFTLSNIYISSSTSLNKAILVTPFPVWLLCALQ